MTGPDDGRDPQVPAHAAPGVLSPQAGDEDLDVVAFQALAGRHLVVEEKVDGANAGISFGADGALRLQSRGHYLVGGPRERHFALFKAWAARHREHLHAVLGDRYILYGEWLYPKHTVFYDALPHYFLAFDVLDTAPGDFLSTDRWRALLAGTPVESVPVLFEGPGRSLRHVRSLLRSSRCKTDRWREGLARACRSRGLDPERILAETDASDLMEGLYVKVEEGGHVVERYKLVRETFLQVVAAGGDHWLDRPLIPNQLRPGVDLFVDEP